MQIFINMLFIHYVLSYLCNIYVERRGKTGINDTIFDFQLYTLLIRTLHSEFIDENIFRIGHKTPKLWRFL